MKHEKAFFEHNKLANTPTKLVTRSSSVFYFQETRDFRTQIHFLNYWLEKRGVSDVEMTVTIRDMCGTTLGTYHDAITRRGGYVLNVREILNSCCPRAVQVIEGSIEIEFFSEKNLVFPFPAVVLRYLGEGWHTSTHSSQRYYSLHSGDEERLVNEIFEAEEGNLTIHADDDYEPFFIIHNGPLPVPESDLEIIIRSETGRKMSGKIPAMAWTPYQTRLIRINDHLDSRAFLAGERGTYVVRFLIGGVFPRLIAGTEKVSDKSWSVDHTNFASRSESVVQDTFQTHSDTAFKDLVFCIPNNFTENWECFADLYPTYPDDGYDVDVTATMPNGEVVPSGSTHINIKRGTTTEFPRITVQGPTGDGIVDGMNFEVNFRHDTRLPRRFHMGVHYKIGTGLPGFLTDGPMPYSSVGPRVRWMPVFDPAQCKNHILVAARHLADAKAEPIQFDLLLFNSFGGAPLNGAFRVSKNGTICLNLANVFPDFESYLDGKSGWLYIAGDRPNHSVVHYASALGENSIAVDHAF